MSTDPQPEPPQTMAQELPKDFKMPDIVKTAELRKGPVNQRTVTWMNEVQSHLDHRRTWSGDSDGYWHKTSSSALRYQARLLQVSKEEEQSDAPMKPINRYIEEDLQPAIDALVRREEKRQNAIREEAQKVTAANKRKREKDEEREREMNKLAQEATAAKKRKREEDQEANKKLNTIINELHTLRESVDGKIGKMDVGIRRKFLKLESKILDRMVASDSEEDTVDNNNNNNINDNDN